MTAQRSGPSATTHAGSAPPPTVGDLVTSNQRLEIGCHKCGRHELIAPAIAVQTFGAHVTYPQLRRIAKCSKCGARGADGDIWARASVEDHYRSIGMTATAGQGETRGFLRQP